MSKERIYVTVNRCHTQTWPDDSALAWSVQYVSRRHQQAKFYGLSPVAPHTYSSAPVNHSGVAKGL